MKRIFFFFFLSTVFGEWTAYGQHTKRFKEITKNLIAMDTSYNEYYYSNGALKKTGASIVYQKPEYTYHKDYGRIITYYKSGTIKSEQIFDNFGNILDATFYHPNGTTWWKSETLKIDCDLVDFNDFFVKEGHVIIVKKIREYKYGEEIGKTYLRSEGIVTNGGKNRSLEDL